METVEGRGASNVRVFGSVARGDFGPESDIDLLIHPGPDMSLFGHVELAQDLEDLLGCKVNLVSDRGLRPRVRERVMKEAVPLGPRCGMTSNAFSIFRKPSPKSKSTRPREQETFLGEKLV